ncbi:MAG: hypothetical protein H5T64_05415 [Chloroflexi bacterium]|nr:hypothetical protein [Chloroflexota bacterium]
MSKVLVFVHGAGITSPNYYEQLLVALEQLTRTSWPYRAVRYSPECMSPDRLASLTTQKAREKTRAERQLQLELLRGVPRLTRRLVREQGVFDGLRLLRQTLRGIWQATRDLMNYEFCPAVRACVRGRLLTALQTAPRGDIVLISHSLGTVICFDLLRQRGDEFKIATWFTTGSPLGKFVRLRRRSHHAGEIAHVGAWQNLYDPTDLIAGPLAHTFRDCPVRDRPVDVGILWGAHNYWPDPKVHRIIAGALRRP